MSDGAGDLSVRVSEVVQGGTVDGIAATDLNGVTSRRASEVNSNGHSGRKHSVGKSPIFIEAARGTGLKLNGGLTHANDLRFTATRSARHSDLLAGMAAAKVVAAKDELTIALRTSDLITIGARRSQEAIARLRVSDWNFVDVVVQCAGRGSAPVNVNGETADRPRRMNGVGASVLPLERAVRVGKGSALAHPIARVADHLKVLHDGIGRGVDRSNVNPLAWDTAIVVVSPSDPNALRIAAREWRRDGSATRIDNAIGRLDAKPLLVTEGISAVDILGILREVGVLMAKVPVVHMVELGLIEARLIVRGIVQRPHEEILGTNIDMDGIEDEKLAPTRAVNALERLTAPRLEVLVGDPVVLKPGSIAKKISASSGSIDVILIGILHAGRNLFVPRNTRVGEGQPRLARKRLKSVTAVVGRAFRAMAASDVICALDAGVDSIAGGASVIVEALRAFVVETVVRKLVFISARISRALEEEIRISGEIDTD